MSAGDYSSRNIGFVDDYNLNMLQESKLLCVVAGKAEDCFDIHTGKVIHSFDFIPGVYYIASDRSFWIITVKGTQEAYICNLNSMQISSSLILQNFHNRLLCGINENKTNMIVCNVWLFGEILKTPVMAY